MGLETAALIALGGAGAAGIAGAVKGAKGTKDQVANTSSQTKSKTTFDPASAQELALQQSSLRNYLAQEGLAQDQLDALSRLDPLQRAAVEQQMGVLSGQAFNLTPQEFAGLQGLRESLIAQGTDDVNNFVDQRGRQLLSSSAARGVRGQALLQPQQQLLGDAAKSIASIQNAANQQVAQAALSLPYQRVAAQQAASGQGLTLAEQLRQNAIATRQQLQNPYLLNLLQQERLAGGTQNSSTSGQQLVPGQKGSFTDAVLGGLTGAFGGAQAGANLYGGIQNIGLTSDMRNYYQSKTPGAQPQFQADVLPVYGLNGMRA